MHLVAIGGSDAGISAALRARELDPSTDVTVVVADSFPNFSICGIPYYVSGEVTHWRNLAHRTAADLAATGMQLRLDAFATTIDADAQRLLIRSNGREESIAYDALVIGTGATSVRPPVGGLHGPNALSEADGVHLLHSMGDTFSVMRTLTEGTPKSAVIVGAGYIGLEMAEALTARGLGVTQIEMQSEVLPTIDPELGALVRAELSAHGVEVLVGTTVDRISRVKSESGHLQVEGHNTQGAVSRVVDLVLVVSGVRPDTSLAVAAGAQTGVAGAIVVDEHMRTGIPRVFAAGDCVVTHHRQLGITYLPLGTTAHKQGRVAGENAIGGDRRFRGSLGTQVVKIFDLAAARTGLREHEAVTAGFAPATSQVAADDHKAYYPGAHSLAIRVTGDRESGRLLGAQIVGHKDGAVAKRIDTYAAALYAGLTIDEVSDLDLAYTPPLGSPWDAVQAGAQAWIKEHLLAAEQSALRVAVNAG